MNCNDRHARNWFRFRRIFRFVTENESLIIFYYIRLKSDIPMKSDNHIYNRKSDDSSSIWLNPFLAQPFFGLYLGTKVPFTNLEPWWGFKVLDQTPASQNQILNFDNFENDTINVYDLYVGWIARIFKIFIWKPKLSFLRENHEQW